VMGLSILAISPTTVLISIQAFLRGLDPDMVVYPIISSTADVAISFFYVLTLTLLAKHRAPTLTFLALVTAAFTLTVANIYRLHRDDSEYRKTIREFILTLVCVSVIVNVTGYTLGRISDRLGSRPEVYAIYPAMIDTVGDVGSMTGSTATTKLSLGTMGASLGDLKGHVSEISYGWIGSFIMFMVYALVSACIYGQGVFWNLAVAVLATNLLVIPIIALISFVVGIVTFRRGLDPDNFIIPFETSLADSLTTIFLYLTVSWRYRM